MATQITLGSSETGTAPSFCGIASNYTELFHEPATGNTGHVCRVALVCGPGGPAGVVRDGGGGGILPFRVGPGCPLGPPGMLVPSPLAGGTGHFDLAFTVDYRTLTGRVLVV